MKLIQLLKRLNKDETGSVKVEYLLIIAAIVLPLLGILIWYRNNITTWLQSGWAAVSGRGVTNPDNQLTN
jgi:Flp pilus assembly pilin Flp